MFGFPRLCENHFLNSRKQFLELILLKSLENSQIFPRNRRWWSFSKRFSGILLKLERTTVAIHSSKIFQSVLLSDKDSYSKFQTKISEMVKGTGKSTSSGVGHALGQPASQAASAAGFQSGGKVLIIFLWTFFLLNLMIVPII